jgi:hypothetical protein
MARGRGEAAVVGRIVGWLIVAVALSACAQSPSNQSTTFLERHAEANPTLASFRECHGFACNETSRVSLSPKDWRRVTAVFRPPAKDAKAERQRIAQGVLTIRRMVGAQTGTGVHQWTHKDMIILPNNGDRTQLDCIDEAVNTWTYMTLMERAGLFRFHRVAKLSNADSLLEPRNTAVMQEIKGDYFAIDPSLVDFGTLPPVMPLATWLGPPWPPNLSANAAHAQARQATTRRQLTAQSASEAGRASQAR